MAYLARREICMNPIRQGSKLALMFSRSIALKIDAIYLAEAIKEMTKFKA